MKQLLLVLGAMIALSGVAYAKVTPEQDRQIGDGSFVAMADGATTVGEYIQAPLPIEMCTPWVSAVVVLPDDDVWVDMTLVYVDQHSSGPYVLFSTDLVVADEHFMHAVREKTRLWAGRQIESIAKRDEDQVIIVRLQSELIKEPETFNFVGLITGTHQLSDRIELKCTNIPAWMVRAWPGGFDKIRARW